MRERERAAVAEGDPEIDHQPPTAGAVKIEIHPDLAGAIDADTAAYRDVVAAYNLTLLSVTPAGEPETSLP